MNLEIKINEKLSCRLRDEKDAEEAFTVIDRNRDHLRPWFPWVDTTIAAEDQKLFIIKCREEFEAKKSADFGIYYEGIFVGSGGFHTIKNAHAWGEIGYWLDKEYTGRGIMTDFVRAMITYGFKELNLHRIQIKCDADNLRSKAIPERLGFKLEGTIREDHKHEDGTFSDGLVYGLLAHEWKDKAI